MRLDVYNPKYSRDEKGHFAWEYSVFLDDIELHNCWAADDKEMWAKVYEIDENGRCKRNGHGVLITKKLEGNVRFELISGE